MDNIYKNIEECNPINAQMLIVLDDTIAGKLNPIVTKLFIGGRKLNISLAFITQSYFAVPNNSRLNSTNYVIMKMPNKREIQQIAFNHSSDIETRNSTNSIHPFIRY